MEDGCDAILNQDRNWETACGRIYRQREKELEGAGPTTPKQKRCGHCGKDIIAHLPERGT